MDECLFYDPTQISTAEIQLKMHTLLTLFSCWSSALLFSLLYIQLTISFLIGLKRTVNFWNQRLRCHLAADYTIIMSRTLKVTGNDFMYDRGAWFLRVIMSSSCALCCLPSVKKQKHDFKVCFVDGRAGHRKHSWRLGLTKHKKVDKGGKEAVCWLREREKKTEGTCGKERVGTNFENILCRSEKERIRSMYNKTITLTEALIILDTRKTSSNNCLLKVAHGETPRRSIIPLWKQTKDHRTKKKILVQPFSH